MCKAFIRLISFLLFLTCGSALAQGDYLKPGEDGFDLNLFLATSSRNHGYGINLGFSAKGVADVGFTIEKIDDVNFYSPNITLHLLKQDYVNFPLNFSLATEIWTNSMDEIITNNYYTFTPVLFSNLKTSGNITLQPSFQVSIIKYNTEYSENSETAYGFGLSFFKELESRDVIRVESAIAFQEIYGNT